MQTALEENCTTESSDRGSIPLTSTRWVLDEHLLLQRRLRRESIVLIPSKKHHLEEIRGGAFFLIHTFDFRLFVCYAICVPGEKP